MVPDERTSSEDQPTTRTQPPTHISLPPLQSDFQSPDLSPLYYSAPSSPAQSDLFYTPPTSPQALQISIPSTTDDPFPDTDLTVDLALDDDGLNALEKIYLFASSKAPFHRVYITHALPDLLSSVSSQEAIEYVLPLLNGLAMDEEEQVKEALALQLVSLIWWFFTHCDIISDVQSPPVSTLTAVSIHTFTPILGTLLLSPNPLVSTPTRGAIVDLLLRLKAADDSQPEFSPFSDDVHQAQWSLGSFDGPEREMVRTELLQQVVIGMGRLDIDTDDQFTPEDLGHGQSPGDPHVAQSSDVPLLNPRSKHENVNPYFPTLPTQPVPSSSQSKLSSSALMAGHLPDTIYPTPSTIPNPNSFLSSQSDNPRRTEQPEFTLGLSPVKPAPLRGGATPMPLSPTDEKLVISEPPIRQIDRRQTKIKEIGFHAVYDIRQDYPDTNSTDNAEEDEQAAVGRLSSMSLMAAVTSSGTLGEETQDAFVKEVVRVGQDSVYWVRREASFALGALAKVVPDEAVICSLLPLFNTLRRDAVWHVRHSALFALPAILSRLPGEQRRSLALDTIMTLATDESSAVQSGVLEALGEVIYSFREDTGGPPEELVGLFLGRREDRRVRDGQQTIRLLYNAAERPLICAFNYPAVALTLGRERWSDLRQVYLEIAGNREFKVRRTLAASLGEMAKIVGSENVQRDLIGVWWDGIRCEEEEVRMRAVECTSQLMGAVDNLDVRDSLVLGLVTVWDENGFRSWREREGIVQGLVNVGEKAGPKGRLSVVALLRRALEDGVAAVREAGVRAVAGVWPTLDADALQQLRTDVASFAQSPIFKQRMTFIACQHALADVVPVDNAFFSALLPLADDPIDAVRIRLARLIASVPPGSSSLLHITSRLSRDLSPDVRAYALNPSPRHPSERFSTFSRPPIIKHASSKDAPVAVVSVSSVAPPKSDPRPVDPTSSHDISSHPISAVSNTDIDGKTASVAPVAPVPA